VPLRAELCADALCAFRGRVTSLASVTARHSPHGSPRYGVPTLWIISAARPDGVLRDLAMDRLAAWPNGVYRMVAPRLPMHVVVISELPRERETLMLRLMGAQRVLREALEDLQRLPSAAWERRAAAEAIDVLRSFAPRAAGLEDRAEEAIIMSASETYERIKGEGVLEGLRRVLLRQLELKFGPVPQQIVVRVHAADVVELERWAERLVSATTLEEAVETESTGTVGTFRRS